MCRLICGQTAGAERSRTVGSRPSVAAKLPFGRGAPGCQLLESTASCARCPTTPPLSSRGLGRRPLTAETRVRIPVAVLRKPRQPVGVAHPKWPSGGQFRHNSPVIGLMSRPRSFVVRREHTKPRNVSSAVWSSATMIRRACTADTDLVSPPPPVKSTFALFPVDRIRWSRQGLHGAGSMTAGVRRARCRGGSARPRRRRR